MAGFFYSPVMPQERPLLLRQGSADTVHRVDSWHLEMRMMCFRVAVRAENDAFAGLSSYFRFASIR